MKKAVALIFLVFTFLSLDAQITLSNNIGDKLVNTGMMSCEQEAWGRIIRLSNYGIGPNEQLIIESAQLGIASSTGDTDLYFSVLAFKDYSPEPPGLNNPLVVIGQRGMGRAPKVTGEPQIFETHFDNPIVVPGTYDYIMINVEKSFSIYDPNPQEVVIAGTEEDIGDSWFKGCEMDYRWRRAADLPVPVPDANFYITATGKIADVESTGATTRLSHNVCDDIVKTGIHSCKDADIYWARTFELADFGISNDEEYIINTGQVGMDNAGWTANLTFNIYKIDENFPSSFSEANLIGSSQTEILSPFISRDPEVVQIDFESPVVVPAEVDRILVEVHKGVQSGRGVAFISGSTQDNDVSWQRGCIPYYNGLISQEGYVSTAEFGVPNANFYINVTGAVNHVRNNFAMNISNICSEFLKEFSIDNDQDIASVSWDFGDPAAGEENYSEELSPYHDFSQDGIYTITATVKTKNATEEILTETIDVKQPPMAYGLEDVYACAESFNPGFATFYLSNIRLRVLQGQQNKVVTFFDGSGNTYEVLSEPFRNSVKDRETIRVRVAHADNACCYSETSFDLIVKSTPHFDNLKEVYSCDDDNDGFALFNLRELKNDIIGSQTDLKLELFRQDGQIIPTPYPKAITNATKDQETLIARLTNTKTDCAVETSFQLIVRSPPAAQSIELTGCDDNGDGISEYFDTSSVEAAFIGNQEELELTYFDATGRELPFPLPNPYTNTQANHDSISVRVTDPYTGCSALTTIHLITSSKPAIRKPEALYACDVGGGFGVFDLSALQQTIIGNQTGLELSYFDANGNALPYPIPSNYENTTAWNQHLRVRVENSSNPLCYAETGVDLIVNPKPEIEIEEAFTICNLQPYLELSYDQPIDSWEWQYEDGTIVSTSSEVLLEQEGDYVLTISNAKHGISCTNSYSFELKRSAPPRIQKVDFTEWSANNTIEIIATGEGIFEYSIDGVHFQDHNQFAAISGGIYNVVVRDKKGCGRDTKEVVLLDYDKVFTPNQDGYNDYWKIKGIDAYPHVPVRIYDRYGKLLKQLTTQSKGWDGTYNSTQMPSDDYWFQVDLGDGRIFSNHFTLKR